MSTASDIGVPSSSIMPNEEIKAPLVDRPLDPEAAERVQAPGIGVILTIGSDPEILLREAADTARVRKRLVYVFIIASEFDEKHPHYEEWEKQVFRKSHAIKSDRFKIPLVNVTKSLEDYCRAFDIRLLMLEERHRPAFRFPWSKDLVEMISYAPGLPPTFIVRSSLRLRKNKGFFAQHGDWVILGVALVCLGVGGILTRGILPEAFELMIYILALAIVSSRVSRVVSVVGSFLAACTYNLIHIPPYGSLKIVEPVIWLNLIGLMIVSLIISTLSWQVRTTLTEAQLQERRKSAFFNLTRDLLKSTDMESVLKLVERHIRDVVGSEIAVYVKKGDKVEVLRTGRVDITRSESDRKACELALDHGVEAGIGTQAQPLAHGLYLPIGQLEGFSGCLGVYPDSQAGEFPAEQLRMLDTFTGLLGISLQRIWFEEVRMESERKIRDASLQNTLLRSVSHDLKTPLTSITGFANQLYEDPNMPVDMRKSTYQTIRDEAWRLTNLINNLLSLTKLESGALQLNKEVMFVEELFGTAVSQVRPRLHGRKIKINLPEDIPDVSVDSMLMNQALINLIENAIKYTPEGTTIELRGSRVSAGVQLSVLDNGPGLPKGSMDKIFEKFVRSVEGRQVEGTGLGLAIVRAIAELHGGTATARNRTTKGARFDIRLPAVHRELINQEEQNEHSD